jgi:hypothetical protein
MNQTLRLSSRIDASQCANDESRRGLPWVLSWGKKVGPGALARSTGPEQRRGVRHMPERISVIRVEGNLAKIQLRGGHEAIICKSDIALVAGKYWRTMQSNSGKRVVFCVEDGKTVFLHRLLVNPDQKHNVYHHNGDGLDNRRKNLWVPGLTSHLLVKAKKARSRRK